MSKFNVGDPVIRVIKDNGTACARIGQVAQVVSSAAPGMCLVAYPRDGEDADYTEVWYEDYAELYTPEEPKQKQRTKSPYNPGARALSPLPEDSEDRKTFPLYSGLFAYFPAALARVAHHSYLGNEKHNPGLPLQHTRHLSPDHKDALLRHLMEADYEGVAWRALALLQEQAESEGAPIAPAAR